MKLFNKMSYNQHLGLRLTVALAAFIFSLFEAFSLAFTKQPLFIIINTLVLIIYSVFMIMGIFQISDKNSSNLDEMTERNINKAGQTLSALLLLMIVLGLMLTMLFKTEISFNNYIFFSLFLLVMILNDALYLYYEYKADNQHVDY